MREKLYQEPVGRNIWPTAAQVTSYRQTSVQTASANQRARRRSGAWTHLMDTPRWPMSGGFTSGGGGAFCSRCGAEGREAGIKVFRAIRETAVETRALSSSSALHLRRLYLWTRVYCEDQRDDDPGGERSADREHRAEDEPDLSAAGGVSGHSHSGLSEQSSVRTAAAAAAGEITPSVYTSFILYQSLYSFYSVHHSSFLSESVVLLSIDLLIHLPIILFILVICSSLCLPFYQFIYPLSFHRSVYHL